MARIANSPFVKVEATRYTEVGFVGKDVESMVKDLVDAAMSDMKKNLRSSVRKKAEEAAIEKMLVALGGSTVSPNFREAFRKLLVSGQLDKDEIDVEIVANVARKVCPLEIVLTLRTWLM